MEPSTQEQSSFWYRYASSKGSGRDSLSLNAGQVQTNKPFEPLGRSTLDLPHTRSTVIFYPDGDAQITGAHYFPGTEKPTVPESQEEKRRRAAGRASGKVHAMAKFHDLNHLWTITRRGGIADYNEAVRVVQRFKRLLLREYPQVKAIFVPELHTGGGQNDGKWHIHFAVHGFLDVKVLRQITYRIFGFNEDGKPNGQINVSSAHVEGGSSQACASYITAYITKNVFSESRQKNQRYYFITRSCLIPNLRRDRSLKYGIATVGRDYKGRTEERESRLMGLIFHVTGKIPYMVWKSEDGSNFRMATFGRRQHESRKVT